MFRRILVPLDGSLTSSEALLAALRLPGLQGGQLRLVHLIEAVATRIFAGTGHAQLLRVFREEGDAILQRALAVADAAEVSAETRLLEPDGRRLGEVIADEARAWRADLIVVGTQGRHGLARALLGSGAEQILRLAPVPVFIVPRAAGRPARFEPSGEVAGAALIR